MSVRVGDLVRWASPLDPAWGIVCQERNDVRHDQMFDVFWSNGRVSPHRVDILRVWKADVYYLRGA